MSKVHKEKIECIHCKAKGMFDIWDSMNVDLDPELREKVFNDEVFLYTCPKCDHQTVVPYGTLYHDVKHRFLLFFDFFKPDDFNYKPIDVSNEPRVKNISAKYIFRTRTYLNKVSFHSYTLMRMMRRSRFNTLWKATLNNARLVKRILVCR